MTILTIASKDFVPLQALTVPNKEEYAAKWGCHVLELKHADGFTCWDRPKQIKHVLKTLPADDWLWFMGSDTLIMNMLIDWKTCLVEDKDMVIGWDILGINNDSFFIKHTPKAIYFLEMCCWMGETEKQPSDQEAMAALIRNNFIDCAIVSQRNFNSYLIDIYKNLPHMKPHHARNPGHDGNFQAGDFVIHFPALTLEARLQLATDFLGKVIR